MGEAADGVDMYVCASALRRRAVLAWLANKNADRPRESGCAVCHPLWRGCQRNSDNATLDVHALRPVSDFPLLIGGIFYARGCCADLSAALDFEIKGWRTGVRHGPRPAGPSSA